ncbi:hypothetical protein [Flavivirga jejuensis]|uniref:Uncharacterized protein n=1 Tax=Flavivirga jejuensis TaxID=870487 RepID=A0ABT8WR16_9FLAO|nr:hypothetical protein [Flavivirga jejuensis]MDO5975593.1 hypothetical protein [Flavivirga jejuensis]
MAIKFDSLCPTFYEEYKTENLDYADETRQIVCEQLGFEPSLNASCLPELSLRKSLKRFKTGKLEEKKFQVHVETFCNNIKLNILRAVPEQRHLFDRKEAENYTR